MNVKLSWDEILKSLKVIGVDTSSKAFQRRRNWVHFSCPLAKWLHSKRTDESPSCGICVEDLSAVRFKCFSCHEQGSFWELVDAYGHLSGNVQALEQANLLFKATHKQVSLRERLEALPVDCDVEGFVLEHFYPAEFENTFHPLSKTFAKYLCDRGIERDMLDWYTLKEDTQNGRIVYVVKDDCGRILGAQGRTIRNEIPKYFFYWGSGKDLVGGLENIFNDSTGVLVVEGFTDLLRIARWAWEEGLDVVCTFGTEPSQKQIDTIFGLDKSVYIWYDNDSAGEHAWDKLRNSSVYVPVLRRAKLPSDIDPGDMTLNDFESTLKTCRRI